MNQDKLILKGIRIDTLIGLFEWERQNVQELIINLVLILKNDCETIGDDISKTVNYAELVSKLRIYCLEHSFYLLESLVEKLASYILNHYSVNSVRIEVIKPGILHEVDQVSIEIVRGIL